MFRLAQLDYSLTDISSTRPTLLLVPSPSYAGGPTIRVHREFFGNRLHVGLAAS